MRLKFDMGVNEGMAYKKAELDSTDRWLMENDAYFTDPDKNKRKKLEFPYETPRMELTRVRRIGELPFSSLWKSSLYDIAEKGVDVSAYLSELED